VTPQHFEGRQEVLASRQRYGTHEHAMQHIRPPASGGAGVSWPIATIAELIRERVRMRRGKSVALKALQQRAALRAHAIFFRLAEICQHHDQREDS
jgi:hypothetical protein